MILLVILTASFAGYTKHDSWNQKILSSTLEPYEPPKDPPKAESKEQNVTKTEPEVAKPEVAKVKKAQDKEATVVFTSPDIVVIAKDKKKIVKKKKQKSCSVTKIIKTAKTFLGTKYRFGGTSKKGIDCSGFTLKVFKKHGTNLPRTASKQASKGKHVAKKNLKPGDLVFFKNTYKKGISHTGIYLGNNLFIHASSSAKKVVISSLSKRYYRKHYAGARRL